VTRHPLPVASGAMPRFEYRHEDSRAALASNWRRVLLVDAAAGTVVLALGVASVVGWNPVVGWILVLLGLAYVLAIIGRYRTWRVLRRESGFDA
jgi:thiosulfate reductase cytochrome b subunit